jgi:putative aldouronate transport system permease protein
MVDNLFENCKSTIIKRIIRRKWLYLIILPGVLYFIIFKYIPYFYLVIAFKDYNIATGISGSEWVGFKHFLDFFNGPYFTRILRNTLLINVYTLAFGFPIPIIFALLLNEIRKIRFKKLVQTVSYLPHFISSAVVVGMAVNFLSPSTGIINTVLSAVFGVESIHFLIKPEYFRTIYVVMDIWKSFGWTSVIYIAAITGIGMEQYESAIVDGAGRWRQMWYITLPGIKNVIIILFILRMGRVLDVGFETILLLYNPMIYETADVIDTFVYRRGIVGQMGLPDFSYSTAVGLFKSAIGFMLVLASNKLSKKVEGKGLF